MEVRRHRIEPLWDRVDRNRLKLAFFVTLFVVVLAAVAEVVVVVPASFVLAVILSDSSPGLASAIAFGGVPFSVVAAALWVAWCLNRSEPGLLAKLGAQRVPTGELRDTKRVLHDMAIAAGFRFPPPLFVLETSAVNAFALGRRQRSAVVGVTRGLLKRLTPDEQRAVFANLLARLRDGDVRFATIVSALMSPVWAWREADLTAPDDELFRPAEKRDEENKDRAGAFGCLPVFLLYAIAVAATELLYLGHMQQQILTSEQADARGMLLLKAPQDMLAALERTIPEDNFIPRAGASLAPLFFCWTGTAYCDERDPEMRRVARLRETLGAEGATSPVRRGEWEAPEAPRAG